MNQMMSMEEQDLPQQDINTFLKHLETLSSPEEKLKASISFMKEALAQEGTPNFKGFWEVRKTCLPLFKEQVAAPTRIQLWSAYIELTREGRRLKNLLDEETAFAVEQIDLAITSLEEEVDSYHDEQESLLAKTADTEFQGESRTLENRFGYYQQTQKRLNFLNVYASRINALRKELIRTEMRIRQKNKFFQRLSLLGDRVFPPRKELIQAISEAFLQDVTCFVEDNFSEKTFSHDKVLRSVFFFRKEIKALQAIAKHLTLNTHSFSSTREMLSSCWDKLKGMEKELKKEFAEHKQQSSEKAEKIKESIEAFVKRYAEGALSLEEGFQELNEISRSMREVHLARHDVVQLKNALKEARQPLEEKREEEEKIRREKDAQFEKARQEKIEEFQQKLKKLQEKIPSSEIPELTDELEECRKELTTLSMTKVERQQLDRLLKQIRDQIGEKKQEALLSLSEDERVALEDLEQMLVERQERRKEIKTQLEEYRKIIGGSGLDFEKAMRYNELVDHEKESLAKIDDSILEIQKKIKKLKQT